MESSPFKWRQNPHHPTESVIHLRLAACLARCREGVVAVAAYRSEHAARDSMCASQSPPSASRPDRSDCPGRDNPILGASGNHDRSARSGIYCKCNDIRVPVSSFRVRLQHQDPFRTHRQFPGAARRSWNCHKTLAPCTVLRTVFASRG